MKTWSLKDPKSVEEVHPAWPESRVIQTKVAQTMIVKGQILAAVGHLASAVDLNFKHPACLTVYSKPVRAVKMNSNVPVGGLVLFPDSVNVKVAFDLSSLDASAAVRVTVEPNPLPDQYYFLAAATATDLMSPLWCAQTTTEEGDANMTWSKYEVQSVTGFDYIGRPNPAKLQGKSVIKGKSSLPAGDVEQQGISTIVSIPVLINRRALKKGESLLVFKAPPRQATPGGRAHHRGQTCQEGIDGLELMFLVSCGSLAGVPIRTMKTETREMIDPNSSNSL